KEWIIPQDKAFFSLLEEQSLLVLDGAKMLRELLHNYKEVDVKRNQIKDIEHKGDEVVHKIQDKLSRTFITPIDREDIDRLSSLYDDVLDFTYTIINKLYFYGIEEITPPMTLFGEVILKSVTELNISFRNMRSLNREEIDRRSVEVHFLENEADELLNKSVAELFKQKDVVAIIKYKEIYEDLERLTDVCEDVSNLLRDIVLKHS
ncbi:MAG: DUF47 domain-containing protein, partial [Nitrososphaerales archaeon]